MEDSLINFIQHPESSLEDILIKANSLDENTFRALLVRMDKLYYNTKADISNEIYENLQEIFNTKYPSNPHEDIGADPEEGEMIEKCSLPYFLGSLVKIKTEKSLNNWLKKYNGDPDHGKIIQEKIDGLSLYFEFNPNGGSRLITRGRTKCRVVTHLIPFLNLPVFDRPIILRGECIIYEKDYKIYGEEDYSCPRSMVSGLINSDETRFLETLAKLEIPQEYHLLHFVVFRIFNLNGEEINGKYSTGDQIDYLRKVGFETPRSLKITTAEITIDNLIQILTVFKQEGKYFMDGLVVYDNDAKNFFPNDGNPKHAIAFKIPSERIGSIVTEVVWIGRKSRKLKPAIFYENIYVSKANCISATGNNARFIIDNKIGPGAKILVCRNGEIIPGVAKVIEPAPNGPSLPDPMICGEYDFDGVEFILKQNNSDVIKSQIEFFLRTLEIQGFGEGKIAQLFSGGFTTLNAILEAVPTDFDKIEGFGEKTSLSLFIQIQEKIRFMPLNKILVASCIFPNFGQKRINSILKAYPFIIYHNSTDPSIREQLIDAIQKIQGFKKLAVEFVDNIEPFKIWLSQHPKICIQPLKNIEPIQEPTEERFVDTMGKEVLTGKKIVFTMIRDADLEKKINDFQGQIVGTVSSNTDILIVADKCKKDGSGTGSNSLKKALDLNSNKRKDNPIQILTIEEFKRKYYIG